MEIKPAIEVGRGFSPALSINGGPMLFRPEGRYLRLINFKCPQVALHGEKDLCLNFDYENVPPEAVAALEREHLGAFGETRGE